MSRYRKVDPRIWNDSKFRKLTDQGKLAFFLLLTHPHMTAIGAMRGTLAGLAAELGWTVDAMRDAIQDAIRDGMVVANEDASFLALPNFLKYNKPEGPNSVLKAWPAALELLPECPEKRDLAIRCKQFLQELGPNFLAKSDTSALFNAIEDAINDGMSDGMSDGIGDAMSEPSRIQEQEQEQEQKNREDNQREGPLNDAMPDGMSDGIDHAIPDGISAAKTDTHPPEPSPSATAHSGSLSLVGQKKPNGEEFQQGVLEGTEWQPPEGDTALQAMVRQNQTKRATRLPADYRLSEHWLLEANKLRPELSMEQIATAAQAFVSYWSSKPGREGLKLNWFSTWLNWVRKERPWPTGTQAGNAMGRRLLPPSDPARESEEERQRKIREFKAQFPGARLHNY